MKTASPMLERCRQVGRMRWPWIILLLILAVSYYGSYVRYGIGFRDEGQTVALGAQRLLDGEVPFKQVVLNYNVLWFYPVAGLFKLFGVNYVLLRGWCLALSTLTAVLSFLLVERTTRKPWLAFLVATVLVLIPGSPFKNYIPLLAVANTFCLLHVALTPADSRKAIWLAFAGGMVLGLSFLIRIDIALIFAAIWIGLLLVRLIIGCANFGQRAIVSVASLAVIAVAVVALHWPVWADAQRRGFQKEFAAQYLEKWHMLEGPVTKLLRHTPARPALPAHAGLHSQIPHRAALAVPDGDETPQGDKNTLQRAGLQNLTRVGENSGAAFVFLTYAPLLSLLVFIPWGLWSWLRGWRRRDVEEEQRGLAVLVLLGGALSTFPQFFFFRPDVPHLSEFMPGFLTSSAAAAGLIWTGEKSWRYWRCVFTAFLVALIITYVCRILPDRWAGTYTIRLKRTRFFAAENGVRVFVSAREQTGLVEIQKLLKTFAPNPRDYVVCYPYSPGINLLANRPTYERNVYIDNATRSSRWDTDAISRFEKFQPAAIVLSDWDINGTNGSRFSVWAVKTKTWIQTHYTYQGTYIAGSDAFEVYTREASTLVQ